MEEVSSQTGERGPQGELCVLVYRRPEVETEPSENAPVILIEYWDKGSRSSLFFNPSWRTFVSEEDIAYVESLFEDLRQRAEVDLEGLSHHLTSLHVGPVVTAEVKSIAREDDPSAYVPPGFARLR